VDYANPSSPQTFQDQVNVVTDHITFLRVPVDQPDIHFQHIQDLVFHFSFPLHPRPLPLSALRRIIALKLVSRIRPLLAFQPLTEAQASTLDMQIAHKVHAYLGMPFHFNSTLLSLPVNYWGFGFPSIVHMNAALAVAGIQQDLNHHISFFCNVAHVTLADWACQLNHCAAPLTVSCTSSDFNRQKRQLPCTWLVAHKTMKAIGLSFYATDLAFLLSGAVSLLHLFNLTSTILPNSGFSPQVLSSFSRYGFTHLHHVGTWTWTPFSPLPTSFSPFPLTFPNHQWILTRDWPILTSWLNALPSALPALSHPHPLLLLPQSTQQSLAENSILRLSSIPALS
jgi:hypothetical protein